MNDETKAVFDHLRGIAAQAAALGADFEGRRRLIDEYFRLDGNAADVVGAVVPVQHDSLRMQWVCAPDADPDVRVLYIHGGSWVSGSPEGYQPMASRISEASGAAVLLVDYRLAPENPFPAGLEDCVQAFGWMTQNGPRGNGSAVKTVICGDSAGGNLTLATGLALTQRVQPQPDGLIALSPATDFTGASESLERCADLDPVIHPLVYRVIGPIYLGDADPCDPLASPVFGDFSTSPPVLLQVGSAEVLLDDSIRLADKARADGAEVELQVWDGMPHVFQGFAPRLSKATEAVSSIGRFVRQL